MAETVTCALFNPFNNYPNLWYDSNDHFSSSNFRVHETSRSLRFLAYICTISVYRQNTSYMRVHLYRGQRWIKKGELGEGGRAL